MKPYAVAVTIGDKVTGKEFDTETELKAFLLKAEELKKKAPSLLVKVIRNGIKKASSILDPHKEDSLAWRRVERDGKPVLDRDGKQLYQCVPAPAKKGVFYCPYCNAYKQWKKVMYEFGLEIKGCGDCEMSEQDFYIKTANNLWKGKK